MQDNLKEIIRILWSKGLPFVAYRLPGQDEVKILVQQKAQIHSFDVNNIEAVSGFVMAPFNSSLTERAFLLIPDLIFNPATELKEIEKLATAEKNEAVPLINKIWTKEAYLNKASDIIHDLKKNKLQKLVLSRVIEQHFNTDFDQGNAFVMMLEKFPDAFNYTCHLPSIGSWIGATPETFLRIHNDVAETVSLAGTKPIDHIDWTLKERREQAIVTDFISYELEQLGIVNYKIDGPETVVAGNVAHLSSKFTISKKDLIGKAGKLIKSLHPTPAVCGLPQKEAFEYLLQIEDHDRKFYTGFLGPWQMDGHSDLFVNLRCAEFDNSKMHIFVGGGFTPSSIAESEWEETVYKSNTMLSVAENF